MRYFVQTRHEIVVFDKKSSRDEYAAEEVLNGETNVIAGTRDTIDGVPIADLMICVVCFGTIPPYSRNGRKLGPYQRATKKTCGDNCFIKLMRILL